MTAALSVWDADRRARTALATCRYEPWPARYWVQVAGTEITLYDVTRWQSRGDLTRIGFAVLGLLGVTVPYVRWGLQARPLRRQATIRPATDAEALACLDAAAGRARTEAV